jgi:hypothetical protein
MRADSIEDVLHRPAVGLGDRINKQVANVQVKSLNELDIDTRIAVRGW